MRQRVRVAVDCLPARKRSLVSVVAQQLAAHASRPTAGMGSNAPLCDGTGTGLAGSIDHVRVGLSFWANPLMGLGCAIYVHAAVVRV
jgi:hypothetical protein